MGWYAIDMQSVHDGTPVGRKRGWLIMPVPTFPVSLGIAKACRKIGFSIVLRCLHPELIPVGDDTIST